MPAFVPVRAALHQYPSSTLKHTAMHCKQSEVFLLLLCGIHTPLSWLTADLEVDQLPCGRMLRHLQDCIAWPGADSLLKLPVVHGDSHN